MPVGRETPDFDLIVIGGGSGGYAAARTAAGHQLKTAVIEGGKDVGGLCILRGCMPTKALLAAAEVMHLVQRASLWGVQPGAISFDFKKVMARKNALIAEFAAYRRDQLSDGRFSLIRSRARFLDPYTIALDDGSTLRARAFIISTGSVVSPPPIASMTQAGYITSDDALTLETPPPSLAVLGGGAVAVEFAQFFARFGVKVDLVQRSPHILRDFDDDAAVAVEGAFRREGIKVWTGTRLLDVRKVGADRIIRFEHEGRIQEVRAAHVLHALGREAATTGLDLDKAGVATERGRVISDRWMCTSQPHIYAAGDCTGPYEIVHIAIQQGETAAHNIARPDSPRSMDYRLLTSVVFTEPQVASVGLTEKAARAAGRAYLTASYPFSDHGKSQILDALDGFVKLLADPNTGEILGGCCVGPMGGELIHEIIAAMSKRMTVHELAAMPHYHPTLAEIWTYPAEELAGSVKSKSGS
jgi:pyruvate/2-oxoglutarate dehydrogenase complex dihydrolipoamide dehydrogenase (E3) component